MHFARTHESIQRVLLYAPWILDLEHTNVAVGIGSNFKNSNFKFQISKIQKFKNSKIQKSKNPKSKIQSPKSKVQSPKSKIQNPKSKIQNPKSKNSKKREQKK
jgi:hypothetical protein